MLILCTFEERGSLGSFLQQELRAPKELKHIPSDVRKAVAG